MNKEDLDTLGAEVGLGICESKVKFFPAFAAAVLKLMARQQREVRTVE